MNYRKEFWSFNALKNKKITNSQRYLLIFKWKSNSVARNSAQLYAILCSYAQFRTCLIPFLFAIIAQLRAKKWPKRKQPLRAIPLKGFSIGNPIWNQELHETKNSKTKVPNIKNPDINNSDTKNSETKISEEKLLFPCVNFQMNTQSKLLSSHSLKSKKLWT